MMSIGGVVIARCWFDAIGETMVIRSKGDGDEGAMMANVDCIYAAVSKRQMPSDERIEFILCKHEMNTGMRYRYTKKSINAGGESIKQKKTRNDDRYPIYLLQFFPVLQGYQLI
jgi:hypothetical protein